MSDPVVPPAIRSVDEEALRRLMVSLREYDSLWRETSRSTEHFKARLLDSAHITDEIIGHARSLCASAAPVVPAERLAQKYFDACCYAEGELDDALCAAFGVNVDSDDPWPFKHMVYDPYDSSFEVWRTRNDFEPTDEQITAVFALGFSRGWICYQDGTEVCFYDGGTKRGERHKSVVPRDSDQKYRLAKIAASAADRVSALTSLPRYKVSDIDDMLLPNPQPDGDWVRWSDIAARLDPAERPAPDPKS